MGVYKISKAIEIEICIEDDTRTPHCCCVFPTRAKEKKEELKYAQAFEARAFIAAKLFPPFRNSDQNGLVIGCVPSFLSFPPSAFVLPLRKMYFNNTQEENERNDQKNPKTKPS